MPDVMRGITYFGVFQQRRARVVDHSGNINSLGPRVHLVERIIIIPLEDTVVGLFIQVLGQVPHLDGALVVDGGSV